MTDHNTPANESTTEQPDDDIPDDDQFDDDQFDDDHSDDGHPDDEHLEELGTATQLRRYLDRALLVAFLLLAAVAALQFYFQVGAAIEVWIAEPYEPVVKAGFNLAVLLFAAAGLSYQLRRVDSIRPGGDTPDPSGE